VVRCTPSHWNNGSIAVLAAGFRGKFEFEIFFGRINSLFECLCHGLNGLHCFDADGANPLQPLEALLLKDGLELLIRLSGTIPNRITRLTR
jgi:hypothetical protein